MISRRYLYCVLGVALAGAILFLLLTFLSPRAVEAQSSQSPQPASVTQGADQPLVVFPNPPQVGEPTELRVFWHNDAPNEVTRFAQFSWSNFGIGQERHPFGGRIPFVAPAQAQGTAFIIWVPPDVGPYCFYADIFDAPDAPQPIASYMNNVAFLAHPDPGAPLTNAVLDFPLRNPLPDQASIILTLTMPAGIPGWQAVIEPHQVALGPGGAIQASVVFTYTGNQLPPGGTAVFNVNAAANGMPIGGLDIVFGPPVQLHMRPDPLFAESEISVSPYPVPPGEPAEICAEVRNVTRQPRDAQVFFSVAPFGIGMIYGPAAPPVHVFIPELGIQRPCIHWVAPNGGQFAFEVHVETPGFPMVMTSQRVVDVSELLLPGTTSLLHFPVRNPFPQPVTVTLGMIPMQEWQYSLSRDVLQNVQPNEVRVVTMTVTVPPGAIMPSDGTPVVDIEAYVGRNLFGGFRKIYRPPVPIHQPGDPIYAEREISISPYPPREREPTEICVDIRNPTSEPMTTTVVFSVAEFGIGLPFHDIARPIAVGMPAHSIKKVCITWVPPFGGRFAAQVGLTVAGHEQVYSQRVIDVGEILYPNQPSPFEFVVGNPFNFPITVTLGAIRYLPQWEVTFNPPVLVLPPGVRMPVVMIVNPVQRPGDPEPQEGQPVIDVEAYWHGNGENGLLGGFRKLFFPPIPIHQPQDPPYAEREINIFPYPPRAGEPTHIEFVVRNPTTDTQQITVTFEVGSLGIGLPFQPIQDVSITLHPGQVGVAGAIWVPPFAGEFCVRVRVDAPFFREPFYSSRNISIVRLPEPYGQPEVFHFAVGHVGSFTQPVTVTLASILHLPDWQVSLAPAMIVLQPGQIVATAVMTLTPPADPTKLPADGSTVVDVEGYVDGNLIGGIRKVWRPPVPLGHLGEPSYAESEITIRPDPPVANQTATFSAVIRNDGDFTQTLNLQFGWADYGFGIPFSTENVTPTQAVIKLSPHMTTTVSALWKPKYSGHFCVQILLTNPQTGESIHSQRNVDALQVPENRCASFIRQFLLHNPTSQVVTVTMGSSAINLPPGWTFSVDPDEATLNPGETITVTVVITPPCGLLTRGLLSPSAGLDANSPTRIQVEGYDQAGEFVGGIEVQLTPATLNPIYLPSVFRTSSASTSVAPEETGSTPRLPYGWAAIVILGGIGFYYRRSHYG